MRNGIISLKENPLSLDIRQLYLWPDNPRLIGFLKVWTKDSEEKKIIDEDVQQEIINLLSQTDLDSLIESIDSNGFLKFPDKILVRKLYDKGKEITDKTKSLADKYSFLVIEGNRRIAALKLMFNSWQLDNGGNDEISFQYIKVPVVELEKNETMTHDEYLEQIYRVLGVRHVHGVRNWSPWQQAEIIRHSLKSSPTDINERKRLANAWSISQTKILRYLRVACAMDILRSERKTFYKVNIEKFKGLFSHFLRIMRSTNAMKYFSWDDSQFSFTDNIKRNLLFDLLIGPAEKFTGSKWNSRILKDETTNTKTLVEYLDSLEKNNFETNTNLQNWNKHLKEWWDGPEGIPPSLPSIGQKIVSNKSLVGLNDVYNDFQIKFNPNLFYYDHEGISEAISLLNEIIDFCEKNIETLKSYKDDNME